MKIKQVEELKNWPNIGHNSCHGETQPAWRKEATLKIEYFIIFYTQN